jgi:hypothetical protein
MDAKVVGAKAHPPPSLLRRQRTKAREVGKEVPEPTGFRKPEVLTMRTAPAPPTVHAELLWEQDTVEAGREFQLEALVGYTITGPA